MPTFDHVVTIAAVVIGPAGIWFGWWLSEQTATKRRDEEADAARLAGEQERAVTVCRLARSLASEARSLAHAVYLKKGLGREVRGMEEVFEIFNESRRTYRDAVLSVRVLGPSWVVAPAELVEFKGQQMTEIVARMQMAFSNEQVQRVNEEIPAMDAAVDALVEVLGKQYNPEVDRLPARPDMETAK